MEQHVTFKGSLQNPEAVPGGVSVSFRAKEPPLFLFGAFVGQGEVAGVWGPSLAFLGLCEAQPADSWFMVTKVFTFPKQTRYELILNLPPPPPPPAPRFFKMFISPPFFNFCFSSPPDAPASHRADGSSIRASYSFSDSKWEVAKTRTGSSGGCTSEKPVVLFLFSVGFPWAPREFIQAAEKEPPCLNQIKSTSESNRKRK